MEKTKKNFKNKELTCRKINLLAMYKKISRPTKKGTLVIQSS